MKIFATVFAAAFALTLSAAQAGDPTQLPSIPTRHEAPANACRVLFCGDSITRHGTNPEIVQRLGWDHFCGMAASAEPKDYVHLFSARVGETLAGRPVEIIYHPGDGSAAAKLASVDQARKLSPHLVVIQLGEHEAKAEGEDAFRQSYGALLDAYLSFTPRPVILCTGSWAPQPDENGQRATRYTGWAEAVDRVMRDSCAQRSIPFVPVEALALDPACRGTGTSDGVRWHPNDAGHAGYARLLFEAFQKSSKPPQ